MNCLFCCGQLLVAPVQAAAEESCATRSHEVSGEDDCCSKSSSKSEHSNSAPCHNECCILSAPLAEVPSAAQFHSQQAATAHAALFLQTATPAKHSARFTYGIQPCHKQDTYLHCCIFLI
ncbi:MAG TPA: hypothetical protein PLQ88_08170 [Blastocatellia bacterium]|nr:hypothetical protein [Blastocatellia bacterium]